MDAGADSFQAFVDVQDHLLTLASVHAERLVFERFHAATARAEGAERVVLERLLALYALSHIESDRGWFLEEGLFEGTVAKAVRAEVNALLGELRPDAVALVAAWGIPDELLASDLVREPH
jgi:acyl-CoA oxidase